MAFPYPSIILNSHKYLFTARSRGRLSPPLMMPNDVEQQDQEVGTNNMYLCE